MAKKIYFQIDHSQLQQERVMLVGVNITTTTAERSYQHQFEAALDEAKELIKAVEGDLQIIEVVKRNKIHAALFVGTGKAEELSILVAQHQIDLVVFNHQLSPTQERNLEKILQCRVLDRVGLILAIFAKRAQTKEGKLQVELAQLNHLSSRLVRGYHHLQSQKGGIGLKGPGETQLETDRRLIAQKIIHLKKQIEAVKKQRNTQRKGRLYSSLPIFSLVGYTNTGKSSLFNRLTKAEVLSKDQLFATLDTTSRRLWLSAEVSIFLTDTVGFVRDLPHELIAAFSATLEETALADVLLHVIDISHPDYEQQIEQVNQVLKLIGASDIPQILVYNKIDLQTQYQAEILENKQGLIQAVFVSVTSGIGLDLLRDAIIRTAMMLRESGQKGKIYE